jgi:dolichol-phosphate mannosyltransferase
MDISIVIPVRNEEESLKALLPSLVSVLKNVDKECEVLIVDDASTDKTADIVGIYCNKCRLIKLIKNDKRSGQTGCYQKAFKEAKGQYIIRMDGDMQDSPTDLFKFIDKINEGAELVMGLRDCRKHKKVYRLASYIYDILVLLFFNSPLHANSGSFLAIQSNYVKNIVFKNNDHRYLPLIAMSRGAKNVAQVIVSHNKRIGGRSKYSPVRKLLCGLYELMCVLFRIKRGYYLSGFTK